MLSAILFVALISSTSVMCETPDPDEEPLPTRDNVDKITEPPTTFDPNNTEHDDERVPPWDGIYDPGDPKALENITYEGKNANNVPGNSELGSAQKGSHSTPWFLIFFFIIVFIGLGVLWSYIVYDLSTLQKGEKDRKQSSPGKPKDRSVPGKSQSGQISDTRSSVRSSFDNDVEDSKRSVSNV